MSSTSARKPAFLTRVHPRYPGYSDLAVYYEGYKEEIPVRAPDISAGGIFINTSRRFPEGAILRVEFRLRRTDVQVKVRGEVRYCLPGVGVGVEFIDISPESQRAIEEEMSSLFGVTPSVR